MVNSKFTDPQGAEPTGKICPESPLQINLQMGETGGICDKGLFMAIIQSCVFRKIYSEGGLRLERGVHCSDKEVGTKWSEILLKM